MKTIMLALIGSFILSSCNAQAVKEDKKLFAEKGGKYLNSTSDKPDVRVKVNKEYDRNGNIIRYDSTYTYFFSGPGHRRMASTDSLLKPYPDLFSMPKGQLFMNDSLFKHPFFNDKYLEDHFEMNRMLFDRMFQHMDSIKNNSLKEYHPVRYPDKKRV